MKKRYIVISVVVIILIAYCFCLPRKLFNQPYSTVVEAKNGELLGARISDDSQWRFPECKILPYKYEKCLVYFEDEYFRWHWGVNPISMGRAMRQNIKAGHIVSGGSSITMQVIRMSRGEKRNYFEKIIEIILATRLEFRYSKDKILALYASHAPFGGNVVGLDAASWRYFGRNPNNLSWAEAAMLAILPNNPANIHVSKNREQLFKKRNILLKKLCDKQIISPIDYKLAIEEPLPDELENLPQIAPHLTDFFYKNNKGERTISSINKNFQLQTEEIIARWNKEFSLSNIYNIAAIIIDNQTNSVVAYCGNADYSSNLHQNKVDILRAERSPGSILKPFLYMAMLQEGEILPKTLEADIPTNINGFSPENFSRSYEGAVSAKNALAKSLNVPFVWMLRQYSVPKFHNFLKSNQIVTLPNPPEYYGLSLIIGGCEARVCDVASSFANMSRILQKKESIKLKYIDNQEDIPYKTTFSRGAIWQVFEALKEVNRPEELDIKMVKSLRKVAWKTGTSFGNRDAWAIGTTPDYTVAVWVGNATGDGKPEIVGAKTAAPVMFEIFEILPKHVWFGKPETEFIPAEVCQQSGCLRSRFCTDIDTIGILPNGNNSDVCPYHVLINVTSDHKYRVSASCDVYSENISWFVLPPTMGWYYREKHPEYQPLPPYLPNCGSESNSVMEFIYPFGTSTVSLPKQLDGSEGKVTFRLSHLRKNAVVYWHIDNDFYGTTNSIHNISLHLSTGKHSITCVDNEGNSTNKTITIKEN
ncbi:MAG: penicillin-binding protein 1C [Bacteroidales bacterium]|nr:penicillin-binding protein 1C [Bacteroidales bacterium]